MESFDKELDSTTRVSNATAGIRQACKEEGCPAVEILNVGVRAFVVDQDLDERSVASPCRFMQSCCSGWAMEEGTMEEGTMVEGTAEFVDLTS